MKLYFTRALKYLLKLVIIIALVLGVLAVMDMFSDKGLLSVRGNMLLETLFLSWRGAVLGGAVVLFALAYPKISFTTEGVRGNLADSRDDVINAFATYGYSLTREDADGMTFRANSKLRRLLWQFDDAVEVSQKERYIQIEGTKKIVPRVQLRLNAYLSR